ncbi:MAG: polymer-forming cytoskeletal protein, partial [Planctomycetes bacterium]|nr:polymer-forming cytoskeletal protein [Planctomycetota bacterium]
MSELEWMDVEDARELLVERGVFAKIGWWPSGFGHGPAIVHRGSTSVPALRLDYGALGASGIIVDGDLVVEGVIQNGEQDSGPFLVVCGNLTVDNIAIAGAPLHVAGNVRMSGAFHGYCNHGTATVEGDIEAQALLVDDYFF